MCLPIFCPMSSDDVMSGNDWQSILNDLCKFIAVSVLRVMGVEEMR